MTGPGDGGVPAPGGRRAEPGRVVVFPGDRWVEGAAREIARALLRTARSAGPVSVALAGGSTPEPVYRALAEDPEIPWDRVELWFGDERAVPPDDPRSNAGMALRTLVDPAGIPRERMEAMPAAAPDRSAAARRYGTRLPHPLDLVILGIGSDGHTASLFPGSPALDERDRRVLAVTAPADPPQRLTVTPPVLEAAGEVVVLARGPEKAGAVARALDGTWDPVECPAQLVRNRTWILDDDAASRLPPSLTPDRPRETP